MAARRATWCFAVVLVAATCGAVWSAEEVGGDSGHLGAALGETAGVAASAAPSGEFPTQELKEKSADIERSYLAKQKVVADFKHEKWTKKVQKVKVDRYADYLQEIDIKKQDKEREFANKVAKVRHRENNAKKTVKENNEKSEDQDAKMAYGDERQKKADAALQGTIKVVDKLKNGDGMAAIGDRDTSAGMLARLRIAQAHADNSLRGLTKLQKKNLSINMLHHAVELATGSPTDTNLDLALSQIKDTTKESTRESYEKVERMNKDHENDQKTFAKKMEDAEKMKKFTIEQTAKKTAEKQGKKAENMAEGLELPGKRMKESYDKKHNKMARDMWVAHEERNLDEFGIKSGVKMKSMIIKEADDKKAAAAKEKVQKEECAILEKKKLNKQEGRNKAVSSFSQARKAVLTAQADLNGVKYEEKTSYLSKGPDCQVQSNFFLNGNAGGQSHTECQEKCTQAGEKCEGINFPYQGNCVLLRVGGVSGGHPECVMNQATGVCKTNPEIPKDCTMYAKISGPGSPGYESPGGRRLLAAPVPQVPTLRVPVGTPVSAPIGALRHSRRLLGGGDDRRRRSPTPHPTLDPEVASGMARANAMAEAQTKHEKAQKEGDVKQQAAVEKSQKDAEASALAEEAAAKQRAIAEHAALEKSKKSALAEAERKGSNAEGKMQEMNVKLADADTQNRHCEGDMYRRRRTCACDDMEGAAGAAAGGRRLMSAETKVMSAGDAEIAQKKMDNWERRRYVRRRAVNPTPAARRRRAAFPSPPPPARVPAAVCPCPKK